MSTTRLLRDFLAGNPEARDVLPRRLHPYLLWLAGRLAPDLAEQDLTEDVVQRTWELLLRRGKLDYDHRVCGPMTYLRTIMWTAVRDVRAEHAPPGHRTRRYADKRPVRLRLEPDDQVKRHGYKSRKSIPVELLVDPRDYPREVELRIEAVDLIDLAARTASRTVLRALAGIYLLGYRLGEVSRVLGIPASTLRRQIDEWVDDQVRSSW